MFTNSPPTTTTSLRIDHLDEQSETSSSFISRSNNSPQQGQLQHGNELQNHQGDHQLFVIDPDTNSWRFGNRGRSGGSGVVQSVEEQELLSSIQDLQRQLMEVRDEKEEWIEADKIDSERNEEDGNKEDNKTLNETETKRVVVVSNRLPVSVQKTTKGGRDVWTFEKTSGGLVSALRAAKEELDFLWVGWVGHYIPEEDRATVRQKLIAEHGCVPIFLDKSIVNGYYHGFSNDILWPLFHYEPLPCFRPGQEKKFDVKQWDAYRRANDIFANAVNDILEDTDVCWIHDYHLMLVPRILRRLNPKVPIGFFLHVPFPSSDIYRMLPVRRKILEGVLAADLVGFHTYDYMRHFLSSASRILGVESSPKGIATKSGHFCSLGVFPIGIEPLFFQNVLERPSCQRRVAELCKRLGKVHILIGVDRLDYIKGMPHKLLAYEHLLKTRPEYRGNIVLIQVGVPSRVQVKEYQKLASQVNELVGRINGSFGTLDYTPIHYIQRPVSTEELCALYNVADACVITSIRDGMNLVSHEYVALQEFPCPGSRDGPGMLVLSEFAGAAQSLSGAIRINPWNIDELSDAMHQALSTEKAVRELQQKKLYRYVSTHTSSVWARSFIEEISSSSVKRIDQVTLRLERQQREKETKDVTSEIELTGGKDKQQDGNINVINSLGGNGNGIGTSIETEKGELKSSLGRRSSIHSSTDINTGSEGGQISTSVSGVAVEKYRGQKKEKGISGAVGSGKERSGGTTQSGRRSGRKWRTRRLPIVRMLQAYKQADSAVQHNRVLVLDYDGLLATRDVVPELSRPSPFVTSYLVQLASNPSNLLVVLSGRSRTVLETWLTAPDGSPIDCAIGAENGVFFRENPNSKWENMGLVQDAETWKSQVLPIMQFFSERTPGKTVIFFSDCFLFVHLNNCVLFRYIGIICFVC